MDPNVKKRWVDALLSDDYRQGQGCLRFDNKFCCLAVLCDLYARQHNLMHKAWQRPDHVETEEYYSTLWFMGDEESLLPENVRIWAGLDYCDPIIKIDGCPYSLANLNDNGSAFKEIAHLINEQL